MAGLIGCWSAGCVFLESEGCRKLHRISFVRSVQEGELAGGSFAVVLHSMRCEPGRPKSQTRLSVWCGRTQGKGVD
jgi:hypothetical protein